MSHKLLIILIGLAAVWSSCTENNQLDYSPDKEQLLASNQRQRQAHMTNNAAMLVEELYDTIWSVQNGTIKMNTNEEVKERFEQYFSMVKYYKWDDVEEPVIRISDDGTLATVSVKKITTARFNPKDSTSEIGATLFAWTSSYKKTNSEWKIYQTTSTREEYESADPSYYYDKGQLLLDSGQHVEALAMFEKAFYLNRADNAIKMAYIQALIENGNLDKASRLCLNMIKSGVSVSDEIIAKLKETKHYELILRHVKQSSTPISNSKVFIELSEKAIIPEGIAVDGKTANVYLSSTYKRKIIKIPPEGTVEDFAANQQDGLYSTLGMEVYEAADELWVISAAINKYLPMLDGNHENKIQSKIYRYSLSDGMLIKVYDLKTKEPIAFNDITVSKTGDVFITESLQPAVYKIAPEADEIELFYKEEAFNSFYNGLALSENDSLLFVSHSNGIMRLNTSTGNFLGDVMHADSITLQGIDGMSYYEGNLICHQTSLTNGIEMYSLSPDGSSVVKRTTLESNNEYFDQASTGEIYDNKYIYIANAQMRSAFIDGELRPISELKPHVILEMTISN